MDTKMLQAQFFNYGVVSMKITAIIQELSILVRSASDQVETVIFSSQNMLGLAISINEGLKLLAHCEEGDLDFGYKARPHVSELKRACLGFKTVVVDQQKRMLECLGMASCRLDEARSELSMLSKISRAISLAERAELRLISKNIEQVCDRLSVATVIYEKFSAFVENEITDMSFVN